MTRSRRLSEAEIRKALEDTSRSARVVEKEPSRSDLKAALGVEAGPDGKIDATVSLDQSTAEGRRNAGLYRELYEPKFRAEAERASEIRSEQSTVTIRRNGRREKVQERFAEHLERKSYTPRVMITVPAKPRRRGRRES